MAKSKRKEREKRERREAIVDAAEELIRMRGFEAVTMDEIAELAELSKGALYLYFENKMAIHLAVCERGGRLLNREFAGVLAEPISGLQMIRGMGDTYLRFVQENPVYFYSFMRFENAGDMKDLVDREIVEQCEENLRQTLALMARAIQAGMQDGTIDDSFNPQQLALLVWSSARGVIMTSHFYRDRLPIRGLSEEKVEFGTMLQSLLMLLEKGMAGPGGQS